MITQALVDSIMADQRAREGQQGQEEMNQEQLSMIMQLILEPHFMPTGAGWATMTVMMRFGWVQWSRSKYEITEEGFRRYFANRTPEVKMAEKMLATRHRVGLTGMNAHGTYPGAYTPPNYTPPPAPKPPRALRTEVVIRPARKSFRRYVTTLETLIEADRKAAEEKKKWQSEWQQYYSEYDDCC